MTENQESGTWRSREIEVKVEVLHQRWNQPDRYRVTYPDKHVVHVDRAQLEARYEQ